MAVSKKGGLGKGLDALFIDNSTEEKSSSMVNINDIEPNRDQPRKTFTEEALRELSDSIAMHGVLQPLLVRPLSDGGYQLIAGERRWRASRMAGLTEVPVYIKEMSDRDAMEFALIENLQREDLNPIEEAEGFKLLMDTYSLTQAEAAERVGKSRPAVANALRLLALPEAVLLMVKEGKLSSGHARTLLPVTDEKTLIKLAEEIVKKEISVRETERIVKSILNPKKDKDKSKKSPRRDPYYDECELAIREELGRKAEIHVAKGNKGTIEIEFFSKSDLASILEALAGN
ncbi:MAG: ParB/RepB/Spo0J family partition protein [Acutalibacteraceae bacterium]|nr:ParB/RepB/Spo0J family partition protein [Acutalibacteraceae bacterium]